MNMFWRLALAGLLTAALSWVGLSDKSHAEFNGCKAGFCNPVVASSAAFVGIADIYTNTLAHNGNRAASSAQRGQKLLNVCDASGANCTDWSSSASTGLIVTTLIGGSSCSSITCEIAIAYDDSGANACSGAPCNLTQTHGSRPTVVMSGLNGLPTMACNGSQFLTGATLTTTAAAPFTTSVVAERTGSTSSTQTAYAAGGNSGLTYFDSSAGQVGIYGGFKVSTLAGAVTEGAFHAIQGLVITGATAGLVQASNQTPVTGNTDNLGLNSASGFICSDSFGELLTGGVAENWAGTGNQSATFTSGYNNQNSAYGGGL